MLSEEGEDAFQACKVSQPQSSNQSCKRAERLTDILAEQMSLYEMLKCCLAGYEVHNYVAHLSGILVN